MSRPLVPRRHGSAAAADCVLIECDRHSAAGRSGLCCIDLRTGEDRWHLLLASRIKWAGYVDENLILGTAQEVRGVEPDTGRTVWSRKIRRAPVSPVPRRESRPLALDASFGRTDDRFGPSTSLIGIRPEPEWFAESERDELVAFFANDA